jgi:predicted lipoprotein with Yx(FWY)xxD motif
MTRSRSITFLATAAVVPLTALALASCGGGGEATSSPKPPKTASGGPATVGVATTGLGRILVDSSGRTIYLFKRDFGTRTACNGACASAWPPVRANGEPTVGPGANASLVGTTARPDGTPQLTYNGHPLYLYHGDEKPGETDGEGSTAFGAAWYALSPAGDQLTGQASSSGGGASNYSAGGGY